MPDGNTSAMIAALFVEKGGAYYGLPDVDPWDKERDARKYAGPWPVVAHPPCERWGRYWFGNPTLASRGVRFKKGDDAGCFAAALASVRKWGGILEHPEASAAWDTFGMVKPFKEGGWFPCDSLGWTCSVEQGNYGHRARKATWLYFVGPAKPPELKWGRAEGNFLRLEAGYKSAEERAAAKAKEVKQEFLSHKERAATPTPFRDLLIDLARLSLKQEPAP